MSSVKNYFDTHSDNHAYHYDPEMYGKIFEVLQNSNDNYNGRILDLGCGDGSFLKGALSSGVQGRCLGTDVSYSMIKTAKKSVGDFHVDFIVCDGFALPIRQDSQFDLIHLDSVLHHLIEKTRKRSMLLVTSMLKLLKAKLSTNGILIIEEVYYDSYLVHALTTSIIFYALKILNFLHLDISRVVKEIHLGLEVNFMSRRQIKSLADELGGDLSLLKKDLWAVPIFYKILFLKERGHITYMHKPV